MNEELCKNVKKDVSNVEIPDSFSQFNESANHVWSVDLYVCTQVESKKLLY